jgi:hypothetical protein
MRVNREQHDAEFTSYIEPAYDGGSYAGWLVVYKNAPQGVYATREQARKKIRSLKPFSSYRPLSNEEKAQLEITKRPWSRLTRILQDLYDLDPVYDPT